VGLGVDLQPDALHTGRRFNSSGPERQTSAKMWIKGDVTGVLPRSFGSASITPKVGKSLLVANLALAAGQDSVCFCVFS
jgi:hypothetical protein